jgi:ribosomal protein L16 Arg81 hydroxylase
MTPLHRDPNPNLFVQLAGSKKIRLMKPDAGRDLFARVRASGSHANMRGEEMMAGDENARLEDAVWNEESALGEDVQGWEATLESGDGLYIPLGWWHSVRGFGVGVNASVS